MKRNMQMSFAIYAGICFIVIFTGGLYPNRVSETVFTLLTFGLFYVTGGLFNVQDSKIKNLVSLFLPSLAGLVFAAAATLVYQHFVIDLYHYTRVPVVYNIIWGFAYYINAPIMPITQLLQNFNGAFYSPFGLTYTFFIPAIMMWLGLERKSSKIARGRKTLF